MAKISLAKRQETLKISLSKANISEKIVMRVACALDISGSMQREYASGNVSDFVGKLLPFGCLFDDNEEIDMWAFNHSYTELPSATADIYDDYVGKCMRNVSINGGTNYAPVMKDIYESYFGKTLKEEVTIKKELRTKSGFFNSLLQKKEWVDVEVVKPILVESENKMPAAVFFITDGENSDVSSVKSLISKHANTPVYWFMVGVGDSSFGFLKELAKDYPNVDFISVDSLTLSDEKLYDTLLSKEFGSWVKEMGVENA